MENWITKLIPAVALPFLLVCCDSDTSSNPGNNVNPTPNRPLIIDHTCTDISKIPDRWIDSVKMKFRIHYAHTSHGEQITVGLQRLENANAKYGIAIEECCLPLQTGVVRLFDGQETETYITPDLYWDSMDGRVMTGNVLGHNPSINISMWMWCTQQDDNTEADTRRYLDVMNAFESAYPNVTFIYATGNAQSAVQNRLDRNNQIRNYCQNNKKVLFDFADLDCWSGGQEYREDGIPTQHPQYNGDEAGHTTYTSCENKARAYWWMLARLAGWDGQ